MTTFNKLQQALINANSHTPEDRAAMIAAVTEGVYYIVGIECINGDISAGAMEGDTDAGETIDIPCFSATRAEVEEENRDMTDEWEKQIRENERDADDEWQGEPLRVRWNGTDNAEVLFDIDPAKGDSVRASDTWQNMAGL
jgi:hypothetical protein